MVPYTPTFFSTALHLLLFIFAKRQKKKTFTIFLYPTFFFFLSQQLLQQIHNWQDPYQVCLFVLILIFCLDCFLVGIEPTPRKRTTCPIGLQCANSLFHF